MKKNNPKQNKQKTKGKIWMKGQENAFYLGCLHITCYRLFGLLADRLCQPLSAPISGIEDVPTEIGKLLSFHLANKSALQRYIVGHIIYFWAIQRKVGTVCITGINLILTLILKYIKQWISSSASYHNHWHLCHKIKLDYHHEDHFY